MDTMVPKIIGSSPTLEANQTAQFAKAYSSPKLTHYGDIASLVKLVVVNMADGGAPPFEAQS